MTGDQTAALGCAIALLLPGGCFLFVGIASYDANGLFIGAAILTFAGLLFWVAFSRPPRPAAPPGPAPADESPPDR
jgi:hypothetical protein